jgi:hypothetical protein
MNRSAKSGKSALDLIEEATHLLRSAPAWTLTAYYVGTIPFVVGFLYFWAEMSQSPFADQHVAEAALAATVLFLWMKLCQSVFAQSLLAQVASRPSPSWTARRLLRTFLNQAVIQPTGLFILPLALVFGFPFGWVYAFYQNVTAVADANSKATSDLVRKAWKHASLWPLQNHIVIGAGFLFGLFVFLNWFVVSLSIPSLLKMLFGIENVFTRSTRSMLNTTFVTAMCGLTYLCVDPILKAVYVLRCFYGEALQSGEDLKANLKNLAEGINVLG